MKCEMTRVAYLAGPDVFLPDAAEVGERKKRICAAHGLEGCFPLDGELPPPDAGRDAFARACFAQMIAFMDAADLAIANLTPFRGPSMDVGTAVEVGYMHARARPVFGYTSDPRDYAERVTADTLEVEDLGLADNLMIEGAVRASGGEVVRASAAGDLSALEAFEVCVERVARWLRERPGA